MAYRKRRRKKKITTSKIIMAIILILCLEIIIYTEWVMCHLNDISALYVLIGIPAAMCGTAWAYFSKSKAENSKNGIVYEAAMLEKKAELGLDFIDLEKENDDSVG